MARRERAFFAGASNQISLMKWTNAVKPAGAETKGIHALRFLKLPSLAIFPWVFDHFINEIADCTQRTKTAAFGRAPAAGEAFPL